jgi:hypothetical protein
MSGEVFLLDILSHRTSVTGIQRQSAGGTCGLVAMLKSFTAFTIASGRSLGISCPLSGKIICFPLVER